MKESNKFWYLIILVLLIVPLSLVVSSCEETGDDKMEDELYLYPWVGHPQSYIKFFDYRMQLGALNVQRNGSSLQIDYTLTNVGFGCEVSISFWLDKDAAHDNLGNTYRSLYLNNDTDVLAYMNGEQYKTHGAGKVVNFMPNQTIKGSFTIKNFDPNATAFSISANVILIKPSHITLAYNRMDFVNIPVPESSDDDSGIPML